MQYLCGPRQGSDIWFGQGYPALGFWNSGIRAKGGEKFASIDPLPIATDLKKVFIITELLTAHDAVEFLCGPMGFCIGGIGGIARPDQRER